MIFPYLSTTPLETGTPYVPLGNYQTAGGFLLHGPLPLRGSRRAALRRKYHHRHMRGSAPRLRFARIALVQMHRRRVPRKLRADPFGKRRKVSGKCVFSFQGPGRDVRS